MEVTNVDIAVAREMAEPSLRFDIVMKYIPGREALQRLDGSLLLEDNRLLSFMTEIEMKMLARTEEEPREQNLKVSMVSVLRRKGLDLIEDARQRDPKKRVKLKLKLKATVLESRARLSSFRIWDPDVISSVFPNLRGGDWNSSHFVYYKYDPRRAQQRTDMWIVSGDGSLTFLVLSIKEFAEHPVVIPASTWAYEYAPHLGLGKYVLVEMQTVEASEGAGTLVKTVNEAIKAVEQMQDDVRACDWNSVIEDSRPVFEVLRQESVIKEILIRDGYSEEAAQVLAQGLRDLFSFSSKFLHRLDMGKKIAPEIKASREDAYLIYFLAVGLTNLLGRKLRRLEET